MLVMSHHELSSNTTNLHFPYEASILYKGVSCHGNLSVYLCKKMSQFPAGHSPAWCVQDLGSGTMSFYLLSLSRVQTLPLAPSHWVTLGVQTLQLIPLLRTWTLGSKWFPETHTDCFSLPQSLSAFCPGLQSCQHSALQFAPSRACYSLSKYTQFP